jgi:plastocyanin
MIRRPHVRPASPLRIGLLAGVALAALTSLGGSPAPVVAEAANVVHIKNYDFTPKSMTVVAGEPITWVNDEPPGDQYQHFIHEIEHKGNWQVNLDPGSSGSWDFKADEYKLCEEGPVGTWTCNITCLLHFYEPQFLSVVKFVSAPATPAPTPRPTPRPTATPTSAPTPTAEPTPTASETETAVPTPTLAEPTATPTPGDVAAATATATPAPTGPAEPEPTSGQGDSSPLILVAIVVAVGVAGGLAFGVRRRRAGAA